MSNLPTVWTNMLTGIVLAGGTAWAWRTPALLLSLSLFYVGGMYLNDAFDRGFDARHRPERPIPSGQVGASAVFAAGFAMLGSGLVLLAWIGLAAGTGWRPVLAGGALAAAIVYYDWHHKANPLSPLWMGVCRMLVPITAAYAVTATPPIPVFHAALLLLSYLIGLTYVAKQESLGEVRNLWPLLFLAAPIVYGSTLALDDPTAAVLAVAFSGWTLFALSFLWRRRPGDVPRAVVSLIAGMSLLDALLIAGTGAVATAWLAVVCFALTLALQRLVPGT